MGRLALQLVPPLVENSSVPPVPVTVPNAMLPLPKVQLEQVLLVIVKAPVGAVRAATVKVAVQVLSVWQIRSNVKVTVVEPPQAAGAPVLLFVKIALQPPEKLALANQLLNSVSMATWV